ncbi:MAG: hypothetical protein ISS56_08720 [Anaerolineae bacterium]|nr:hypothetical protein [Anaerolineae bacterium]
MPSQEVLILAMTKMLSGICTAGMTREPDPLTGLRWVRPVREWGSLLPGDMSDTSGRLLECCDVVELDLLAPRPDPPHTEDWLTDFVHHPPRRLRRLEGEKRSGFFARCLDRAPQDVLVHHTRSLCLIKPERLSAHFLLDAYSGKYQARLDFAFKGHGDPPHSTREDDISVTDVKWRALGRTWLCQTEGHLTLGHEDLHERLNAGAIYLALGLSRSWQGKHWLLVVGVHVVPDYEVTVDPENL